MHFERLALDQVDWKELDSFPDRTVYQTRPWLEFVSRTQGAEPVVAALKLAGSPVGYFTGLVVRKLGCRILGSPFRGWTTDYMGLNLLPGAVDRGEAIEALFRFAAEELGCLHVELMDRRFPVEEARERELEFDVYPSYEIDLSQSEEELLQGMNSNARRYIRKAERDRRLVIEEASDADFARDYHAQLVDVFAKQQLTPMYPEARVRTLLECLGPTGNLLLLRARDSTGRCVATGVFPAFNDTMYFWGGASWREDQSLHPNDPIQWHAMRYWKQRGITRYDLGGGGAYKKKYGASGIQVPWLRFSRYRMLSHLRKAAKHCYRLTQRARWVMKR